MLKVSSLFFHSSLSNKSFCLPHLTCKYILGSYSRIKFKSIVYKMLSIVQRWVANPMGEIGRENKGSNKVARGSDSRISYLSLNGHRELYLWHEFIENLEKLYGTISQEVKCLKKLKYTCKTFESGTVNRVHTKQEKVWWTSHIPLRRHRYDTDGCVWLLQGRQ